MSDWEITLTRRQVLGGAVTLGAGSAASGAGTLAAFSDTEAAMGRVTAGSLDLTVTGTSGGANNNDGAVSFLNASGIVPGSSGSGTVTLTNTGTLAGHLSLRTLRVINDGNGLTDPESDVDERDGAGEGELADLLTVTVTLDGPDGSRSLCTGGAMTSFFVPDDTYDLEYGLAADESAVFRIEWHLSADVGNEIQGDSAGIELVFGLSQQAMGKTLPTCTPPNDGQSGDENDDDDSEEESEGEDGEEESNDGDEESLDDRLVTCELSKDTLAEDTYEKLIELTAADAVRTVDSSVKNLHVGGDGAVLLRAQVRNNGNTNGGDGVLVVCGPAIAADPAVNGNVNPNHLVLNAARVSGNLNTDEAVSVIGTSSVDGNANLNSGVLHIAAGATLTVDGNLNGGTVVMGANSTLEVHKNTTGGLRDHDIDSSATVTVGGNDNAGIETE